jgi:hypothetical protein
MFRIRWHSCRAERLFSTVVAFHDTAFGAYPDLKGELCACD